MQRSKFMDIKIIVATHKKYKMPDDPMYIPVHVGAEGKTDENGNPLDLGFIKDNTGDNISLKNKNYCELTGLYWMWKNMSADYMGLMHYRRYLASSKTGPKEERIIKKAELEKLLKDYDIVLPTPRDYFIETTYNQYVHTHHNEDLDFTRDIISEKYPEYLDSFDKAMKSTKGHRFNMFVMRSDILDEYLTWLFDILFELEKRLDISGYTDYDARVFGFVSERILDVWLDKQDYKRTDCPYVYLEKQNWLVKGSKFLLRKAGINKKD